MSSHVAVEYDVEHAMRLLAFAFSHPDEILMRVALCAVLTAKTAAVRLLDSIPNKSIPPKVG
jgi:hypothetical protein